MILTSGTLHPLSLFEQELGLKFPVQLSNGHVVPDENVFVRVVKNAMIKPGSLINNAGNPSINTNISLDSS
jgi:hypothetical protein